MLTNRDCRYIPNRSLTSFSEVECGGPERKERKVLMTWINIFFTIAGYSNEKQIASTQRVKQSLEMMMTMI